MLNEKRIAALKDRIVKNFDMMIDEETTSTEVMCAYLRAVDSLTQAYVDIQRNAIENEGRK